MESGGSLYSVNRRILMGQFIASAIHPPQAGIALPQDIAVRENSPRPAALPGFAGVQVDSSGCYSISNLKIEDTELLLDWLENHGVTTCECSPQPDGYLTVRWNAEKPIKSG